MPANIDWNDSSRYSDLSGTVSQIAEKSIFIQLFDEGNNLENIKAIVRRIRRSPVDSLAKGQ